MIIFHNPLTNSTATPSRSSLPKILASVVISGVNLVLNLGVVDLGHKNFDFSRQLLNKFNFSRQIKKTFLLFRANHKKLSIFSGNFKKSIFPGNFTENLDFPGNNCSFTATSGQIIRSE